MNESSNNAFTEENEEFINSMLDEYRQNRLMGRYDTIKYVKFGFSILSLIFLVIYLFKRSVALPIISIILALIAMLPKDTYLFVSEKIFPPDAKSIELNKIDVPDTTNQTL